VDAAASVLRVEQVELAPAFTVSAYCQS